MSNNKLDIWIWTELLAFDNASPDFGVSEYFSKMNFMPKGITFLLSSPDFILQHENWTETHILPEDICSRRGHHGNGVRKRQEWTSQQFKQLVALLQARGCKVVFNVFGAHLEDKFHREWLTDHPECRTGWKYGALNPLSRLNDGTPFEEFFTKKLMEVEDYYGFDGWHGPDNNGPSWTICYYDDSNEFAALFREEIGVERFPKEYQQDVATEEEAQVRGRWIWENLRDEWIDFNNKRWMALWKSAVDALHAAGKIAIINSPNTKCNFGSLYYLGFDYRDIAKIGVDIMVVETTSIGFTLLRAARDYMTEFGAVMQEMAATMPGVQMCMMPSIKDAVESYDSLTHAAAMFERDFHYLASRHIIRGGKLHRTAESFLVCLGDYITAAEWETLSKLFDTSCSFDATKAGELVWIHTPDCYEPLRKEYRRLGTQESCYQISKLEELGNIDIATIATPEELPNITQPIIVPNFHLLKPDVKAAVLSKKQLTVLLGNLTEADYPQGACVIKVPLRQGYTHTCAILNSNLPAGVKSLDRYYDAAPFDSSPKAWNSYSELPPATMPPDEFWKQCAAALRDALGPIPLENGIKRTGLYMSSTAYGNDVAIYREWNKEGTERVGIYSRKSIYCVPLYHVDEGTKVTTWTAFPRGDLCVKDGILTTDEPFGKPTSIPPNGIIVVELKRG